MAESGYRPVAAGHLGRAARLDTPLARVLVLSSPPVSPPRLTLPHGRRVPLRSSPHLRPRSSLRPRYTPPYGRRVPLRPPRPPRPSLLVSVPTSPLISSSPLHATARPPRPSPPATAAAPLPARLCTYAPAHRFPVAAASRSASLRSCTPVASSAASAHLTAAAMAAMLPALVTPSPPTPDSRSLPPWPPRPPYVRLHAPAPQHPPRRRTAVPAIVPAYHREYATPTRTHSRAAAYPRASPAGRTFPRRRPGWCRC